MSAEGATCDEVEAGHHSPTEGEVSCPRPAGPDRSDPPEHGAGTGGADPLEHDTGPNRSDSSNTDTRQPVAFDIVTGPDHRDPAEDRMDPAEDGADPAENVIDPAEDGADSAKNVMDPAEDGMDPAKNVMDPVEGGPEKDVMDTAEDGSDPAEDGWDPAEDGADPSGGSVDYGPLVSGGDPPSRHITRSPSAGDHGDAVSGGVDCGKSGELDSAGERGCSQTRVAAVTPPDTPEGQCAPCSAQTDAEGTTVQDLELDVPVSDSNHMTADDGMTSDPPASLLLTEDLQTSTAGTISPDTHLKSSVYPLRDKLRLPGLGDGAPNGHRLSDGPGAVLPTPSGPGSDADRSSSLSRRPRFIVRPALNRHQLKYAIDEATCHSESTRLAPPDGRWAWVVLAGSMVVNVLIPGFIKSFGVLFDDVCAQFNASPAAVSWIPALSFFMYNFMGPVAGALCQKYSCRATTMLGGLLASVGLLVSYAADHIYYLYLGLGLMSGCGGCFAYCSGILMVGSYFERRRGLANGLCVSGSALGAMVFPPVLDLMLERCGFSEAMLLLAAVLLNVVPCAALYQPVEWHMVRVPAEPEMPQERPPSAPPLVSRSATPLVAARRPSVLHSPAGTLSSRSSVQSLYYLSTVLHGSTLAVSQKEGSHQIIEAAIRRRAGSVCSPGERPPSPPPPPPPPRRPLVELTLLWNPVFLLMITSSALFQVAVSNVLVILPSYVTHLGYSRQQASLLLSVFAGSDLVGRVGGAAFSDLELLPRRCYLLACYLLCGAALAALPAAAALYAAAGLAVALAGLGTGGVMGIYSVMLIEYLGLERLGSSYGLSVCLSGLTLLGGPPLVGLVRQAAPSPHLVIYLLAVLPFLAAAVWAAMPYAQEHVRRQEAARCAVDV